VEPVVEAPAEVEATVEAPVEAEAIVEEKPVAAPAPAQDMYCPTCGAPVQPGDTFCGNCGAAVGAPPVEAEIAPIEPVLEEEVAEELPVFDATAEGAPVEEWVPEEIVIEEILVEEVEVEEAPAEVPAEAFVDEVVAPEFVEPEPMPPESVAIPEPAPLPEMAPVAETAAGPYLEIVDSGAHIPLVEQPALLIGRVDEVSGIYPDVDLTPHGGEEGGVSRRHTELQVVGGAWFAVDLDSTNGTFLNGTALQSKVPTPLSDGDRLTLGELEIVFHA
jgi:hypothetical protein